MKKHLTADQEARALKFGELTARYLFKHRGDHSEMHISEIELTAMLAAAYEQGMVAPR